MTRPVFHRSFDEVDQSDIEDLKDRRFAEGLFAEYKQDFPPENKKIAKSVASFANSEHGGYLLIGVTAEKVHNTIASSNGIDLKQGLQERVKDIVLEYVSPIPLFRPKVVELSIPGKCVLVTVIPPGADTPYVIDGRVWVRTATGSDPIPETDRHSLVRLYERSEKLRQRVEVAIAEGERKSRAIHPGYELPQLIIILCPSLATEELISELFSTDFYSRFLATLTGGDRKICQTSVAAHHEREKDGEIIIERFEVWEDGSLVARWDFPSTKRMFLYSSDIRVHLRDTLARACEIYDEAGYFGEVNIMLKVNKTCGRTLAKSREEPGEKGICHQSAVIVRRRQQVGDLKNVKGTGNELIQGIGKEIMRAFGIATW